MYHWGATSMAGCCGALGPMMERVPFGAKNAYNDNGAMNTDTQSSMYGGLQMSRSMLQSFSPFTKFQTAIEYIASSPPLSATSCKSWSKPESKKEGTRLKRGTTRERHIHTHINKDNNKHTHTHTHTHTHIYIYIYIYHTQLHAYEVYTLSECKHTMRVPSTPKMRPWLICDIRNEVIAGLTAPVASSYAHT